MEIEEKEIIENYYVDMKEQDEDTVELEVYYLIYLFLDPGHFLQRNF